MLQFVTTAKKSAKKRAEPEGRKKPAPGAKEVPRVSVLSEVGDEARRKAVREALLKALRATDWNLTAAGESLRMDRQNVIRALKEFAPDEYAKAKADGRVVPGKRPADT